MSNFGGDYIGFSYNNVHSSDLGIIRVSDGSRFSLNLLPPVQSKTVQVPGGDGAYYFGSTYAPRQISLSFAFDGITEQQLEYMRELFGDKKTHPLVFDEIPYKIYQAKVNESVTISYIAFSEGQTGRVYKGEGALQFICYQPYAICKNKDVTFYDQSKISEWNNAANLINLQEDEIDMVLFEREVTEDPETLGEIQRMYVKLYNPGVKEADWRIRFFASEDNMFEGFTLKLEPGEETIKFKRVRAKTSIKNNTEVFDNLIILDSKTHLIEGWRAITNEENVIIGYEKSGNIYNECIEYGDFFDIPITITKTPTMNALGVKNLLIIPEIIDYDTLYELFDGIEYNYYYY